VPRNGQHHTEEAKEKIRNALLVNHPTRGKRKEGQNWIVPEPRICNPRGYCSAETRQKLSEASKKRIGPLAAMYGKHHTEEARRKISIAFTGERHPLYGTKASVETRKKLSLSHLGKTDKKSSNWKGGITPLVRQVRHCFKYRQWRSDVFTRDDFTCVFCGKRGCFIEVDHYPTAFAEIFYKNNIKSFDQASNCEEFWNINNGRTLCRECHDTTKKGHRKEIKICS